MQDVAPRAVRMADATEAMICTTHLIVSFFVIRVSFFLFWHGFHGLTLLYFIQLSGTRSPRVWRQSTVACDFTLGPDPRVHFTEFLPLLQPETHFCAEVQLIYDVLGET